MTIEAIIKDIKQDKDNIKFTKQGWEPIMLLNPRAKILIIGQAPGLETQEKNEVFRDKSGDRLRSWLNVSEETFYQSNNFAVLPLDFYYPGKAKTGDKLPRNSVVKKWHPQLLALMPEIELIILAGLHAQKAYLKDKNEKNLTTTVKRFRNYLPKYFPIVHPSPLNQRWEKKNPFFKEDVLPNLQKLVFKIINNK